jgi:SAM-dependent methyltransferase
MKKIFKFFLNFIPRPFLIRLSYWIRPFLSFFLRGNRFVDPIDGKGYRSFLPYGYEKQRENVLAPGTLSLERHRLMWLYLERKTDFFTNDNLQKLLHFAPEQAFYQRFRKQENLKYVTTDLFSPLADVKADICDLPFESNEFDLIFCNHVLEHIPDDQKAMEELFRVLKPGGMGIFQVPLDANRIHTYQDDSIVDAKERAKIFGQYDHVRVYGLDYFDQLRKVGFEVEIVNLSEELAADEIALYGLAAGELLPVCYKKAFI